MSSLESELHHFDFSMLSGGEDLHYVLSIHHADDADEEKLVDYNADQVAIQKTEHPVLRVRTTLAKSTEHELWDLPKYRDREATGIPTAESKPTSLGN